MLLRLPGGEPTVRGLDFFKKAVELQKKYNVNGARISNAIQTNGIAIDAEWARFFADNHFLVGLSLDGNKELHDRYRLDPAGNGTYSKVLRAAQLLTAHKVDFNILTVVTGRPPTPSPASITSTAAPVSSTSSTSPASTRWGRSGAGTPTP